MMQHRILAVAAALAFAFALQPRAAFAQQRIGSTTKVKPDASGSIAGTLSDGSSVHARETVKTGKSGKANLRFIDTSGMSVGPGSTVVLDKFVYDPNKGSGSAVMETSRGALRFISGSQTKGEYKIKTPTGTLGVRG
jgi:hypothetical protein